VPKLDPCRHPIDDKLLKTLISTERIMLPGCNGYPLSINSYGRRGPSTKEHDWALRLITFWPSFSPDTWTKHVTHLHAASHAHWHKQMARWFPTVKFTLALRSQWYNNNLAKYSLSLTHAYLVWYETILTRVLSRLSNEQYITYERLVKLCNLEVDALGPINLFKLSDFYDVRTSLSIPRTTEVDTTEFKKVLLQEAVTALRPHSGNPNIVFNQMLGLERCLKEATVHELLPHAIHFDTARPTVLPFLRDAHNVTEPAFHEKLHVVATYPALAKFL
jgi:hypothetical protein